MKLSKNIYIHTHTNNLVGRLTGRLARFQGRNGESFQKKEGRNSSNSNLCIDWSR